MKWKMMSKSMSQMRDNMRNNPNIRILRLNQSTVKCKRIITGELNALHIVLCENCSNSIIICNKH